MHHQSDSLTFRKDIVLVGGGHAHALVLLQWCMQPFNDARITLISEQGTSPYSGMLPGVVAGHYTAEEIHIDLRRLCQHAGVRFIQARVIGVEAQTKRVLLEGRPPVEYDILSINAGITPDVSVKGARDFAVPVKPISGFLPYWQAVLAELEQSQSPRTIAVIGGGAGSVELVLAMAHRLQSAPTGHHWLLITRSPELLQEYPARLRAQLYQRLQHYRIRVLVATEVVDVDAMGVTTLSDQKQADQKQSGQKIEAQHVFWCTQARPATWLASSGLAVTPQGFLAVNSALQSESHAEVFAAGDCAWMTQHAMPRAGVYAVRQAPVLSENLQRFLRKQALQTYRPQHHFLSLLACGGHDAVGARGRWSIAGTWVWRLKDRIDRRFMNMFHCLPIQPPLPDVDGEQLASVNERCGGCGGKVGGDVLQRALAELDAARSANTDLCPLAPAEDAAIIAIPVLNKCDNDKYDRQKSMPVLVQSVDALKPLFDDPWLFARIATVHALSDLFAMHATPHSAQLLLQMPVLRERLLQRDITQILQGVNHELAAQGAALVGGHTLEADSLQIGLTVNAFAAPSTLVRKRGANPGDVLLLTKPLGTGTLFAAAMRGFSQACWIEQAIANMCESNARAATIFGNANVHALTDITGFGLVGHLQEMLSGSTTGATLDLRALPLLPGVMACLQNGYESTLAPANRRLVHSWLLSQLAGHDTRYKILFDPQTSGGLLAAVAPEKVEHCLHALQAVGVIPHIIGICTDKAGLLLNS